MNLRHHLQFSRWISQLSNGGCTLILLESVSCCLVKQSFMLRYEAYLPSVTLTSIPQDCSADFGITWNCFADLNLRQLPALQDLSMNCSYVLKKLESSSLKVLNFVINGPLGWRDIVREIDLPKLKKLVIRFIDRTPSNQVCTSSSPSPPLIVSHLLLSPWIYNIENNLNGRMQRHALDVCRNRTADRGTVAIHH